MTTKQLEEAVKQSMNTRKNLALTRARKVLNSYYAESVGASILEDFRKNNIKIIHC